MQNVVQESAPTNDITKGNKIAFVFGGEGRRTFRQVSDRSELIRFIDDEKSTLAKMGMNHIFSAGAHFGGWLTKATKPALNQNPPSSDNTFGKFALVIRLPMTWPTNHFTFWM